MEVDEVRIIMSVRPPRRAGVTNIPMERVTNRRIPLTTPGMLKGSVMREKYVTVRLPRFPRRGEGPGFG